MVRLGPDVRLRFSMVDESEAVLRRQMYESAVRDPLTAVFNRRYFLQRLASELASAERSSGDAAVLLIDVDHLKRLNDELGHLVGDRALCALAKSITHAVRAEDIVARYGGDEFAVLAPGADVEQAKVLSSRMQGMVSGRRFSAGGSIVELSACVGVAALRELPSSDAATVDLLSLADARLYEAKRARPGESSLVHGRLADTSGVVAHEREPDEREPDEVRRRAPTRPRFDQGR
jgi:diguanylate cyclase (GGDEF)-like protein